MCFLKQQQEVIKSRYEFKKGLREKPINEYDDYIQGGSLEILILRVFGNLKMIKSFHLNNPKFVNLKLNYRKMQVYKFLEKDFGNKMNSGNYEGAYESLYTLVNVLSDNLNNPGIRNFEDKIIIESIIYLCQTVAIFIKNAVYHFSPYLFEKLSIDYK
jgi:hypothetical protein